MLRTILESADHAERVGKTVGALRLLRHTLKMRFVWDLLKKLIFSTSLSLRFWSLWPCLLSYRYDTHHFGIGNTMPKKDLLNFMSSDGSVMLKKCGLPKNCIFSTSLALRFWSLWACLLSYRNVTHHFGIGIPSLRSTF